MKQKKNEEKEAERVRIEEKKKLAAENEEKQNRLHGQVVLDPKKQKKYEAQELLDQVLFNQINMMTYKLFWRQKIVKSLSKNRSKFFILPRI